MAEPVAGAPSDYTLSWLPALESGGSVPPGSASGGDPAAPGAGGGEGEGGEGGGEGMGFPMMPLSEEEKALLRQITGIIGTQDEALRTQLDQFRRLAPAYERLFSTQANIAANYALADQSTVPERMQAFYASLRESQSHLYNQTAHEGAMTALSVLRGEAPTVSAQQKGLLDQIYEEQRQRGIQSIRQQTEELAAQRGLRMTDTPIGGDIFLRELSQFERGLGAERAGSELALGSEQQARRLAVGQFQQNLQQAANAQRATLAQGGLFGGGAGGVGGGLASPTIGGGTDAGAGASLFGQLSGARQQASQQAFLAGQNALDRQNRIDVAGTSPRRSTGILDYAAAFAPLVGGIVAGFSTARVKKAITPLDPDEYDAALDRVKATPIVRYRYTWEAEQGPPHIGPILELAPAEISDDGIRVNALDYLGLQHAALKAVDRKVEALAARLPIKKGGRKA